MTEPRYGRYMYLMEKVPWFCNLWGFLWYCCTLMTVFLVAVVSVTRCICVTFPLARLFLNKKLVLGIILGYLLVVMCQATIPLWVGKQYVYFADTSVCTWTTNFALQDYPTAYKVYSAIYSFELYVLIVPILVSSAVTVCALNRPSSQMSRSNRSVTVTVLCFTLLYVIFNIPICVVQLMIYLKTGAGLKQINIDWLYPYGYTITSVFTVGANSAMNPCIYVWRTGAFRQHLINVTLGKQNRSIRRTWMNSMAFVMRHTRYTRRSQVETPTSDPLASSGSTLTSDKSVRIIKRQITVQENLNGSLHRTAYNVKPSIRKPSHSQSAKIRLFKRQPAAAESSQRSQSTRVRFPEVQFTGMHSGETQSPKSNLSENNSSRTQSPQKKAASEPFTDDIVTMNPSFTEQDPPSAINSGANDEMARGSQEFDYPFRVTLV